MRDLRTPLPDLAATEAFGKRVADLLCAGDIVALSGELGAGKTTLARAIIAALGHGGEVPSPTFAIMQTYPDLRVPVLHADFYRIEDPREVAELGIEEYRGDHAMIAEWPENAGGFADDPACLAIAIEHGEGSRVAIARPGAEWLERWR